MNETKLDQSPCKDVSRMNLKTLTQQALAEGGFDGLYNVDGACACKADDLFPCGLPCEDCRAGYLSECDGTCDTGECDFHISACK